MIPKTPHKDREGKQGESLSIAESFPINLRTLHQVNVFTPSEYEPEKICFPLEEFQMAPQRKREVE